MIQIYFIEFILKYPFLLFFFFCEKWQLTKEFAYFVELLLH